MTTAKRLAALELSAEQAKAARLAEVDRFYERVAHALNPADVRTMNELLDASPEWTAEVDAAAAPYLVREEDYPALFAWLKLTWATEDALPTPAPAGTAAQLEAWAAGCDAARDELEEPTVALMTAVRWAAATWRYWAQVAREIGEQV